VTRRRLTWSPDWDLGTIPPQVWRREQARRASMARRRRSGGRKPSCVCGQCKTCRRREAQRRRRARLNNRRPQ